MNGLVDAPRRWHLWLSRALRSAGFTPLKTDECVWVLTSDVASGTKGSTSAWQPQRHVHGVLGVHVDDLIGGGDQKWQEAIRKLRTELEFGSWEQKKFTFRGRALEQSYDNKIIEIRMGQYLENLKPIGIPKEIRSNPDQQLPPQLHTEFRGLLGGLQWLCTQGNPG